MADQSLYSPTNPHFFQSILPGSRTHLNIPVAFFTKHLEGRNNQNKTAKVRSDASDKTWSVKMDGLKLTDGWEDFALAHNLRSGDIIVFRYEGEMLFHVTVFGPSCCEIQYTTSHNINDDCNDHINIVSENSSRKKNPRKKVETPSNHSQFVANVTASGLGYDQLYVPLIFARSNGLNKMNGKEIVVLNEEGRSWKLHLKLDKGMHTYIRPGWRSFCAENGMSQGHYTFKLVQKSGTPVIRLCRGEHRPKQRSEPESSSHRSYLVGSATPSGIKNDQLYLPRIFVSSNGLGKGCTEIVLKNEWGGSKCTLELKHFKSPELTVLRKGWTSFCQANRIKVGDPYKFKLVGTEEKPVLFLCPAESNRDKTSLQYSDGNNDVNSKESEEESIEDKNISQECLEIKKDQYWSRCRASSSDSQNRFVILTLTPTAFRTYKLFLPRGFTNVNGINKPRKIILLGQDGVKWEVNLFQEKIGKAMRFGKGWREFCEAQGVKIDESFVLELIWEEEASPVLKFCTKLNSA